MGFLGRIVSGAVLLLLAASTIQSGEEKDLRAVIAKAIEAKGSAKAEAKYVGMAMKNTGTFYGLGEGIPFTGDWLFQGKNKSRYNLEIKVMDQTLTMIQVVNGDKGWMKFNDEMKAMSPEELAEEKEELYAKWVTSLTPLNDKAFKLAALGEIKIGDKAATGVRVSHDKNRDINLYFDKTDGLLVKSEHPVRDVKGGGDREMTQETYYSHYKETMGSKFPTKVTIKRDGKQYVEAEVSEIRLLEMVDDAKFGKP
jgi:hypothetical protein